MSRNSQGNSERHREVTAYLLEERVPDQERGAVVLGLVAHAFAYLALVAAQAIWLAFTAVRVWRRREEGFATAVRTGVHRPTLAGVAAATLTYAILRRIGIAWLGHRAAEHGVRPGSDS
jgi:hypothetical protein